MSGPPTRPGEMSRIADDDREFRITVLRYIDRSDTWREQHTRDDEKRFNDLEVKLTPITSSVNDYNETTQQFAGAKKLVIGIVAIGASIWAIFEAIIYLIKLAKGQA